MRGVQGDSCHGLGPRCPGWATKLPRLELANREARGEIRGPCPGCQMLAFGLSVRSKGVVRDCRLPCPGWRTHRRGDMYCSRSLEVCCLKPWWGKVTVAPDPSLLAFKLRGFVVSGFQS